MSEQIILLGNPHKIATLLGSQNKKSKLGLLGYLLGDDNFKLGSETYILYPIYVCLCLSIEINRDTVRQYF